MITYLFPILIGDKALPLISNCVAYLNLGRLCKCSISGHAVKYFPHSFLFAYAFSTFLFRLKMNLRYLP